MKYQYTSSGYRDNFLNKNKITDGVTTLLISNISIFIIIIVLGLEYEFFSNFGLVGSEFFQEQKLWQPITYLFLHGNILHILFNMLVLWMFGNELEKIWGKNKFLKFYFVCGIGSGIITLLFNYNSYVPVVGASGAIYGLFTAYALIYPNRDVYFYFLFPVKIKYLVLILGVISLISILSSSSTSISHITHLAGMIIGLIYYSHSRNINFIKLLLINNRNKSLSNTSSINKKNIDIEINKILDKINNYGMESLSTKELDLLKKGGEIYYDDKTPN